MSSSKVFFRATGGQVHGKATGQGGSGDAYVWTWGGRAVPKLAFEFIYDVSLFKCDAGTVRIVAEYDVAGGMTGIVNN